MSILETIAHKVGSIHYIKVKQKVIRTSAVEFFFLRVIGFTEYLTPREILHTSKDLLHSFDE